MAQTVQSLFGLTPEQIQAQRAAEVDARALQYAQMDPFQRANYGIFRGASQLGDVLAQRLGYVDPLVKQAEERKGLLSGMNITDPNSLREAAQKAASVGQFDIARNLIQQAQDMEVSAADVEAKRALAAQRGRSEQSSTASERNRSLIARLETKLARGEQLSDEELANARWIIADESTEKVFTDPETKELIRIRPFNAGMAAPRLSQVIQGAAQPVTPTVPAGAAAPETVTTPSAASSDVTVTQTPASKAIAQKAQEAKDMSITRLQDGLVNINTALGTLSSFTANPWVQGITKNLPTQGRVLKNAIESITSTKTIDLINQMKQASKTGATGFGNVTEKELGLLEADIVKLDPQSPTIKEDLTRVGNRWQSILNRLQTAQPQQPSVPTQSKPSGDLVDRIMADPRNAGKTRAQVEAGLRARGLIK